MTQTTVRTEQKNDKARETSRRVVVLVEKIRLVVTGFCSEWQLPPELLFLSEQRPTPPRSSYTRDKVHGCPGRNRWLLVLACDQVYLPWSYYLPSILKILSNSRASIQR